ncbi:MAG: M1 family metallopeptidase, partial [Longimicrobiaceae bacterium]
MAALMEPGISLELARERAATLAEVQYDLALDLRNADRAPGTLTLSFERTADAGDLIVDFRGLFLESVAANGAPVGEYEWRHGHIVIPRLHLAAGRNHLEFRFTAAIAPAGASIIRFDDPTDGARYLYTLLVPSDAHQLFPSFDQPDLKGVFRFTLTVPEGWQVLANGPLEERAPVPEGVRWRFAGTEPISTYLAAFAAGRWRSWESAPPGERPITLYARESRAAEVEVDTLIAMNREAVRWLEGYFGIPFPFAKMDLLLAPAFPFGGMEHVGAIFYNENSFIFREAPTLNQRLGRAATTYHEVAHQWFGDLVTMRWFDDLWLKEGFSTYMAARMQEELDPGTGAWKTFYLRNKPLAYGVDATSGTTPVWQTLPNLELAKSNYGPIVYNKAPAIIKQLEFLVGEEAFRAGLRRFLTRHAYGNASWQELLAALEESSGASLQAFGEHYILRPGMPVVEPVLEEQGGRIRRLALVQRPAREMPGDPGGSWPGRVQVGLGYSGREDVVLPVAFTGDTTRIAEAEGLPVPDFLFANEGDYGYGLFLLDPRSAAYLQRHVGEVEDELLRAMLWGALWDLVREVRLPPADYLNIALRELPAEGDEQLASNLLARSVYALERYLGPSSPGPSPAAVRSPEASVRGVGRTAEPQERFERLLLSRAEDERLPYGMRKASFDALIGLARSHASLEVLKEYVAEKRRFAGESLRPPSRWSIIETLLARGDAEAASLYAIEQVRDTTPEAARQTYIAGAA